MPHTKENRNVSSIPDSLCVCAQARGKKTQICKLSFLFYVLQYKLHISENTNYSYMT